MEKASKIWLTRDGSTGNSYALHKKKPTDLCPVYHVWIADSDDTIQHVISQKAILTLFGDHPIPVKGDPIQIEIKVKAIE